MTQPHHMLHCGKQQHPLPSNRGTGSVAILQSLAFQEQFSWQHDYNLAFLCHRQSQVCCLRQLEALQLSLQLVLLWQLRYQFQESHLQ